MSALKWRKSELEVESQGKGMVCYERPEVGPGAKKDRNFEI
jgi:hypothetical protein